MNYLYNLELEIILNATMKKMILREELYVHVIDHGWSKYVNSRMNDIFRILYNEKKERYIVINDKNEILEIFPQSFTSQYGVYRAFIALYEGCEVLMQDNVEHEGKVYLRITSFEANLDTSNHHIC